MSERRDRVLLFLKDEGKCVRPRDVAERLGFESRTATGLLLVLLNQGYVSRESKGLFTLTAAGRELADRVKQASDEAAKLLREVPSEMGFRFYVAVGSPLGIVASSLAGFRDALRDVSIESVCFHLGRGDFERWLTFIGDKTLAQVVGQLRALRLEGEEARRKLLEAVSNRMKELTSSIR